MKVARPSPSIVLHGSDLKASGDVELLLKSSLPLFGNGKSDNWRREDGFPERKGGVSVELRLELEEAFIGHNSFLRLGWCLRRHDWATRSLPTDSKGIYKKAV